MRRAAVCVGILVALGCSRSPEPRRVRLAVDSPPVAAAATPSPEAPKLRFAVALPTSPHAAYQAYREFADALGHAVDRPVHVTFRRTFAEVNDLMRIGQADLVQLCSEGYRRGAAGYGLVGIAVPVVDGSAYHPAVVIVRADGPIASPADLHGKVYGVAEPACAPGPGLPQLAERAGGVAFARKIGITNHDRAVRAVADGLVDGALVDGLALRQVAAHDRELAARTRVLRRTAPYLTPPIAVHPALDPALRRSLERALLGLGGTQRGRAVLERLGVDRFAAMPPEAPAIAGVRRKRQASR